jgi:hypothetical protein
MDLTLRIARWRIVWAIEPDDDDGPAMSVTAETEMAPGFAPPPDYWEDEDRNG